MRTSSLLASSLTGGLLAYFFYTYGFLFYRPLLVLGAFRTKIENLPARAPMVGVSDSIHCEDLHYHAPSGLLFTACEDNAETRFKWFPPLGNVDDPELGAQSKGSIHIIDPKTFENTRLEFVNFDSTFVTHGIDVIDDPELPQGEAVYIFAVNHVPNPEPPSNPPAEGYRRSLSRIEVFHHTFGTSEAQYIRTVMHPLIRTPNDVYAVSPLSLYVTNDHFYTDRGLMRTLEDVNHVANWTEVVHVQLDPAAAATANDVANPYNGVTAAIALPKVHNPNGLGHGRTSSEILVSRAAAGTMYIGQMNVEDNTIKVVDTIEIDSVVDNPSYFSDPYVKETGVDRSGYVLPGIAKAVNLAHTSRDPKGVDPVMVWYVRRKDQDKAKGITDPSQGEWEKTLLFANNGKMIRSASAAVLVPIHPEDEDAREADGSKSDKRKAWLFVTGFVSHSIVAVMVDL